MKDEIFDEMIRFDVKKDEIIEIENVKNEIDKIFDCDADFELSNKKIIDSNDVTDEIEKINEFETTNFDFFA